MKWRVCLLGEFLTLKRGHDLPERSRLDGDVPVVSSSGITGYHNEARAIAPGVVTGRYGTLGQVFYLEQDYWPLNTALYVVDFKESYPKFTAYFLKNVLKGYQSDKAAVPGVDRNVLHAMEVNVPDKLTQERIAAILSAYDHLIENNQRRMALLEEAARQVYQEWFVRLRFPGYEHTRIVDGVPDGWGPIQLQSIINVTHGHAFQGSHFSEEPTSRILATPGNFRIGGGIKFQKMKFYNEEGPLDSSYVLEPMDLMLTMTDLSQMCDTLGFPALVPKLDGRKFLHNQRIGKVVPLGSFFPKYFLYCLFCEDDYRHHVVGAATGTSVKHTSPKRILSYTPVMPKARTLIEAFEDFARPLFLQTNALIEANQKLRAARDLLLPKLMSGEISV